MAIMFGYCGKLINLDLSSFDTTNLKDLESMFYCCHAKNVFYGDSFIYVDGMKITYMFLYSSNAKPTHESWSNVTW